MGSLFRSLRPRLRDFPRAIRGNVAMIFGLSIIPLVLAAGTGLDYTRAVIARSNMGAALDAAALAVGRQPSKPSSCAPDATDTACTSLKNIANQYFLANYAYYDGSVHGLNMTISNQSVVLSTSDNVPTMVVKWVKPSIPISNSTTVVWGQTKLWVSLVLDNSTSMLQSNKMTALKNAGAQLITTLKNASANQGDVKAAIVPFTSIVNVGTSNSGASWIDWSDWEAPPALLGADPDSYGIKNYNSTQPATIAFAAWGPGDDCPFTDNNGNAVAPFGFRCVSSSKNGAGNASTIPSSGTYSGMICPGANPGIRDSSGNLKGDGDGNLYNDHLNRYFNGCYTSTKVTGQTVVVSTGSKATCDGFSTSNGQKNCTCAGSGASKTCSTQKWKHSWVVNSHSSWGGCVMDRAQDYDIRNTQPSGASGFSAANPKICFSTLVTTLSYDWDSLNDKIQAMTPNGSTNQAVGLAHGWQMLTPGEPYDTPSVPDNTSRYIILLSDGLNTQDRWWGDGSNEGTDDDGNIDDREKKTCDAAKADGVIIYSIFVDTDAKPDPAALPYCASDSSKYYKLTSANDLLTVFTEIGQQITSLRLSK